MVAAPDTPSFGAQGSRPAVYTAIYGDFDQLLDPVPQDVEVDWFCFTDRSTLTSDRWEIVVEEPRFDDARLSAKWPKLLPDRALPDYRFTIWIDGNMAVDSPSFVREALSFLRTGIALFRHPQRGCIYHEAYVCRARSDLAETPVIDQVRHYRDQGFAPRSGLYAGGCLVRDSANETVVTLGHDWLSECRKWTSRDQLSLPVVLSRLNIQPDTFPFQLGRAPSWLALARSLWLTPGTFPHYLTEASARRLCGSLWAPPFRTVPSGNLRRGERTRVALPPPNPWFAIRPHSQQAARYRPTGASQP